MTAATLTSRIDTAYRSRREFLTAFNKASGITLTEQELSRWLSGARPLTRGWAAAFELFFQRKNQPTMKKLKIYTIQGTNESRKFITPIWDYAASVKAANPEEAVELFKKSEYVYDEKVFAKSPHCYGFRKFRAIKG